MSTGRTAAGPARLGPTPSERASRLARGAAMRVLWLFVALLISFGAAGIATLADSRVGTAGRAELTWEGDSAARPALAAAEDSLRAVATELEALSTFGRLAIAELAARDDAGVETAVADGTLALQRVEAAADAYAAALEAVPGIGGVDERIRLSQDTRDRYDALVASVGATRRVGDQWRFLAQASLEASRLVALLTDHDRSAADAALAGSRGDYEAALRALDTADARLAEAGEIRDELRRSVDVATLDRWLELHRAYDAALRELYAALVASDGVVTDRVRRAAAAEQEVRGALPEDQRGLVVIAAEIAQGGLTQAVIEIEQARGTVGETLEVLAVMGTASPGDG